METTVTPIQSTVVSGGPQARGNATMMKLESKVIRKRKKGEGGRGRKFPCGGRAWPAGQGAAWKRFCWRRKEAPRTWVAKDGVADTSRRRWTFSTNFGPAVGSRFGACKLVMRRTPADLSSTEHLTVLNKDCPASLLLVTFGEGVKVNGIVGLDLARGRC